MSKLCSLGLLIGRFFLSPIFIISGIMKFVDFHGSAMYMSAKGFPVVPFFLVVAALIEIICGLALLIGLKIRLAAAILFLYLIPTTIIFHDFWYADAAHQQDQFFHFLKNLTIMGGLLYVITVGGGQFSAYTCCGGTCPSRRLDEEDKNKEVR